MGLEQLAAIRGLLAKQTREAAASKKPARAGSSAAERGGAAGGGTRGDNTARRDTATDPVLIAISRLQRRFPKAFPKKPAPKVPLKVGVLEDLIQQAKALQLSADEIKQAVKTWCDGRRYWNCMVEAAARVGLNGEPVGAVTANEARHAKRMASRRHAKVAADARADKAKPTADATAEPIQAAAAAPLPAAAAPAPVQAPADRQAPD